MKCYCDGKPHDFKLVNEKDGTKTYECPVCKRIITESSGDE